MAVTVEVTLVEVEVVQLAHITSSGVMVMILVVVGGE